MLKMLSLFWLLVFLPKSTWASSDHCAAFSSGKTVERSATNPLKTYLALNLTFPQSGELISIGLTASRILDPDAWISFEDPSENEVNRIWEAMVRSHSAWGLPTNAGKDFVRIVAKGFVDQAGYGAGAVTKLLDVVDRKAGEGFSAQKKAYAKSVTEILRSPIIQNLGRLIRRSAAKSDYQKLAAASALAEATLRDELEQRHPELSEPYFWWNSRYIEISIEDSVAKLLVDTFAYKLDASKIPD